MLLCCLRCCFVPPIPKNNIEGNKATSTCDRSRGGGCPRGFPVVLFRQSRKTTSKATKQHRHAPPLPPPPLRPQNTPEGKTPVRLHLLAYSTFGKLFASIKNCSLEAIKKPKRRREWQFIYFNQGKTSAS